MAALFELDKNKLDERISEAEADSGHENFFKRAATPCRPRSCASDTRLKPLSMRSGLYAP